MLRLHADFRAKHGLGPVRSPWSLLEEVEAVKLKGAVNDRAVLASPRHASGWILERVRWVLWRTLKPVFDRQAEINRESILAVEALIRESYLARDRQRDLEQRIEQLELGLSRLRRQ